MEKKGVMERKRAGSTPIARVDSNEKARGRAKDMSLELFAMEKGDARRSGSDSGQCTCSRSRKETHDGEEGRAGNASVSQSS